jgi:hypothetical protein
VDEALDLLLPDMRRVRLYRRYRKASWFKSQSSTLELNAVFRI